MTRNDLKELIKQVITESRVRSSPMGYNAAIRAAADTLKQKMDAEKAAKAAEDEKLAQLKPVSNISRAVNIMNVL